MYLFLIFILPLASLSNENSTVTHSIIIFVAMLAIFVPLYIYTSYDVGKINYKHRGDNEIQKETSSG